MEENSDFPMKSTSSSHFFSWDMKLRLMFIFQGHSGHFCFIHMDLRLIKCHGVNLSISREASHEVFHISIQNYVEAKLPDPVLWNFTWKNGSLFAFRCNQPGFLKMSCLATIKVLWVSLAFENSVRVTKNDLLWQDMTIYDKILKNDKKC